ncbi:FAD-binding domain-containing protein [Gigaspora margarita]|uniref:FAD-binding domain-containing protein n=1 Tax=Gigaspora margarita TaxID=4874 RepID=A0A8H4B5M9_GIGMA|nr:FAD-binding domain-containing protein [Gigaspora margarita]
MISYIYIVLFFIATIPYQIYSYQDNKCPDVGIIRECLTGSEIKGLVRYYSCGINCTNENDMKSDYCHDIAEEKNTRIFHYPVAIVHPLNALEVSKAIQCGKKCNISVVARAGGHSYESYSIGDKNCDLVVDLVNFKNININENNNTAVVGPGNRLGKLYYKLNNAGFAFPSGNCPSVGVGVILGGGEGRLTREYGMSSDNLIDAQIVLANGTIVESVNNSDKDLLWALQGAGSAGYGIVTNLTLRIHPIRKRVTSYELKYEFSLKTLKFLYSRLNKHWRKLNTRLAVEIHQVFNTKVNTISVKGLYLGEMRGIKGYLEKIFGEPIDGDCYSVSDWFMAITGNSTVTSEDKVNEFVNDKDKKEHNKFKVKSFYVGTERPHRGLSKDGVEYLFNFLNKIKNYECGSYVITTLYGGGKFNKKERNETAYIHRGFLYDIFINMRLPKNNTTVEEYCICQLNKFATKFQKKYTSYESFQNYIDKDLDNWQYRYYGENFKKLVEIKNKIDPTNVFRWNQSIPTTTTVDIYDKE